MKYIYSVVRFVPDPAREEFINIGAIAGSDESLDWAVRQIENSQRARAVDDRNTLEAAWTFLGQVGREIDAFEASAESNATLFGEPLSEAWLLKLHKDRKHIVQLSPPAPVGASSAEDALDRVFKQLIVDPAKRTRDRGKHVAVAAIKEAYAHAGIPRTINLTSRALVRSGKQRATVDFSVSNGRAVQLTQAWSFQTANQDMLADQVKAWGWIMRDIREHGGTLDALNGVVRIATDVDIDVVYVPPNGEQSDVALEAAVEIFDELEVNAVPVERAREVGERASIGLANSH